MTPLLHPDALLAQLITEFAPAKKGKAATPAQPLKPLTKEEYLASNPLSWTPIAVVYHTLEQSCQCCGDTTEVLGSTLVRHSNPRLMAFWEIARTPEHRITNLPAEHVVHQETVEACPSCLRAEATLCDWPPTHSHQLNLFH